jgi:small conductance mechanosensitive channel
MLQDWTELTAMLSIDSVATVLPTLLSQLGRIAMALILWVGGRKVIRFVTGLLRRGLEQRKTDATLVRYICSAFVGLATVALVIVILGQFGVETTSFAALLGGIGLAIGAAWGGLLGHLAAGLFLLGLRPFKVGDLITAAGVTGVVREIGLFGTEIDTNENIQTIIGNNRIFSETIQNYSANDARCVPLSLRIDLQADPDAVIAALLAAVKHVDGVRATPEPSAIVGEVTLTRMRIDLMVWTTNLDLLKVKHGCHLAMRDIALSLPRGSAIPRSQILEPERALARAVLDHAADKQQDKHVEPADHREPDQHACRELRHLGRVALG